MSDQAIRLLERAKATGDPQVEALLLRRRLRAGTLSRSRLELAAYVGHSAAAQALNWTCPYMARMPDGKFTHHADDPAGRWAEQPCNPEFPCGPQHVVDLGKSMSNFHALAGRKNWLLVRFGTAAAHAAFERWTGTNSIEQAAITEALRALDAWLACPSEENRRACHAALPRTMEFGPGEDGNGIVYTPAGVIWWAHVLCIACLSNHKSAWEPHDSHQWWLMAALRESIALAGEDVIRAATSASIAKWALYENPPEPEICSTLDG